MNQTISCCKDCPDRTVEPNCHMTCEAYLESKAKMELVKAAKIREASAIAYTRESIRKNKASDRRG